MEPLSAALDAYRAFDGREPGWIKVELKPDIALATAATSHKTVITAMREQRLVERTLLNS